MHAKIKTIYIIIYLKFTLTKDSSLLLANFIKIILFNLYIKYWLFYFLKGKYLEFKEKYQELKKFFIIK